MNDNTFRLLCVGVAILFTVFFAVTVVPALIHDRDVVAAFAAGFVNPYSSGYSIDVILCWVVLAIWVIRDAKFYSLKHGWACLALGVVPGVAVGFAMYLVLRSYQIREAPAH